MTGSRSVPSRPDRLVAPHDWEPPEEYTPFVRRFRGNTLVVWIEKKRYALVRKGNDVVATVPPGPCCPLYQREHYRRDSPRWRRIERFVSQEGIYW